MLSFLSRNVYVRRNKDLRVSDALAHEAAYRSEVPAHFGDSRDAPDEVVLALRAWMLWRWQHHDNRFLKRRARAEAWYREAHALQKDVRLRGGLVTLQPRTRGALLEWAPAFWDAGKICFFSCRCDRVV